MTIASDNDHAEAYNNLGVLELRKNTVDGVSQRFIYFFWRWGRFCPAENLVQRKFFLIEYFVRKGVQSFFKRFFKMQKIFVREVQITGNDFSEFLEEI